MGEDFFDIELLYYGVAVLDDPVVGVPAGVFAGTGAVAVAAGVEGQRGVGGWKGVDRVGEEGDCCWCATDDLKEDE